MSKLSKAEKVLFDSLINTKDDVIEIWKELIKITERLNKIEKGHSDQTMPFKQPTAIKKPNK
tara:strand:- start:3945 stop:4130 length:186 start_codon:yes stop_codon:yes gene_type:complete